MKKNILASRITNTITNYVQKQNCNNEYLDSIYKRSRVFLVRHPEILVFRSDKGNTTVILFKQQYHTLAMNILEDTNTYKLLNRDPTGTIQQKANKRVSKLKTDSMIDDYTAKKSMIYNAVASKFYGLPKIHKDPIKLRPIISSIDAPNCKIAELITDIMTKAYDTNCQYYIRDSFQLAEIMNNRRIPQGFVIISLDVVSLFSNIPLHLAVDVVTKKWEQISRQCAIPLDRFIELIEFVFNNTCFSFDNKHYRQILGTPMGSKCSPIIALYVMDELLDTCIPQLSFQLPFIKKYVDDLVCVVPEDKQDEILQVFNAYNEHLKFTIEKEDEQNSVPFLDSRMIRTADNIIKLDWYTKPTSSGRYLNFLSDVSMKMKANLVLQMRNRIYKICHPDFYQQNVNKLFNIFKSNSYPEKLLRKLLFQPIDRRPVTEEAHDTRTIEGQEIQRFGTLPNINGLTQHLIKLLTTTNTKIAVKNIKTVGGLYTKTKDRTNTMDKSNVVYRIPCRNCPAAYIGQTSRTLKARLTSHKSDYRTGNNTCALADHMRNTNHQMNFEETKILDIDTSSTRRCFKET